MKFEQEHPSGDYVLEAYRSGAFLLEVSAFALGQYRIQMWWNGPKGREYKYPDGVPPNF